MKTRQPQNKGILSDAQKLALKTFAELPDSDKFYLTGGTALAEFYLGHRRSFDLDLFTTEPGVIVPFSRIAERGFSRAGFAVEVVRRLESFTEFEIRWKNEPLRVQFALDSPFRFAPPVATPLGLVNDFQDLIVDKTLAFFGRAEPRDAVDLHFILQDEDIWEILQLAAKKDPGFDIYWFAVALEKVEGYPDEPDRWPVEMLVPFSPRALKGMFSAIKREIMQLINGDKD